MVEKKTVKMSKGLFIGILLYTICSVCYGLDTLSNEPNEFQYDNNTSLALGPTPAEKILSRKRRYVAFPEGSSFSVAFCMTIGVIGNPNYQYLSWAINWGLAYELPNQTFVLSQFKGLRTHELPKPLLQRRYRRELYNKIEIAVDNMGYNGKECILRALCESAQYFGKRGANMVEELLRTIFSLPKSKVLSMEDPDILEYDMAHRKGRSTNANCETMFPKCIVSLIQLALGTYSAATKSLG